VTTFMGVFARVGPCLLRTRIQEHLKSADAMVLSGRMQRYLGPAIRRGTTSSRLGDASFFIAKNRRRRRLRRFRTSGSRSHEGRELEDAGMVAGSKLFPCHVDTFIF